MNPGSAARCLEKVCAGVCWLLDQIHDRIVVQWKLPASVLTVIQRAGRAGHVQLVSTSFLSKIQFTMLILYSWKGLSLGLRKECQAIFAKGPKGYVTSYGVFRGSWDGKIDSKSQDVPLTLTRSMKLIFAAHESPPRISKTS